MEATPEPSAGKGLVLVVDDEQAMCDVLENELDSLGFAVQVFTDPEDALVWLDENDCDVVLTDLNMHKMNGLTLCQRAHALRPWLPVVVITAFGSLETAVEAIRAGAYDFISKPVDVEVAALALERAIAFHRVNAELQALRSHAQPAEGFGELLGDSEPMRRLCSLIERIQDSDVTVLVTGESGTGKELIARALHKSGRRQNGPFVAINCAALPEPLLESELFGHARGAFTDARNPRTGLFVRASGGTLLLDEVTEMPLGMQVKLLRALQDRKVRPVGSDQELSFNARIIAATNRDIASAVEEGRFREDLYFRLNVLEIEVPPLRARGSDVLMLAQRFLQQAAKATNKTVTSIAADAAQKLLGYHWPGNVRELQNAMERAVALARFEQITVDDLPERIRDYQTSHVLVAANSPEELVPLEEVEKRYILRVLDAVSGQRAKAARILGMDRKTLYRKLERWNA